MEKLPQHSSTENSEETRIDQNGTSQQPERNTDEELREILKDLGTSKNDLQKTFFKIKQTFDGSDNILQKFEDTPVHKGLDSAIQKITEVEPVLEQVVENYSAINTAVLRPVIQKLVDSAKQTRTGLILSLAGVLLSFISIIFAVQSVSESSDQLERTQAIVKEQQKASPLIIKFKDFEGETSYIADGAIDDFQQKIVASHQTIDPSIVFDSLQSEHEALIEFVANHFPIQSSSPDHLVIDLSILKRYIELIRLSLDQNSSYTQTVLGNINKGLHSALSDSLQRLECFWLKAETYRISGDFTQARLILENDLRLNPNNSKVQVIDLQNNTITDLDRAVEMRLGEVRFNSKKSEVKIFLLNASEPRIDGLADMKKKLLESNGYPSYNIEATNPPSRKDYASQVYAYYEPEYKEVLDDILDILYPGMNINRSDLFDKTPSNRKITNQSMREYIGRVDVDIVIRLPNSSFGQ